MNAVNLQASVNNTTQMDRHQGDQSRMPLVHHAQNAEIALDEAEKRIRMPTETEKADGKKIDPRNKKQDTPDKKKKNDKKKPIQRLPRDQGYIVDLEA
jgi:hypothetical protein